MSFLYLLAVAPTWQQKKAGLDVLIRGPTGSGENRRGETGNPVCPGLLPMGGQYLQSWAEELGNIGCGALYGGVSQ